MKAESSGDAAAVVFLKLGGSLITDKNRPYAAREETITRLAREVRKALDARPTLTLLVGHGSGSFGHWAAQPYATRQGVNTPEQWAGYARVAAAAARLNSIVTDAFLAAGIPVLSIQPSATARCRDYQLTELHTYSIHNAFARGLIPLVYGDVALDDMHGGTIISTEDIFVYLADEFHPARILLVGETPGVIGPQGQIVPCITPATLAEYDYVLAGSAGVDVTGGMADKVKRMVGLVNRHPETVVDIISACQPGTLAHTLCEPALTVGTRILAADAADPAVLGPATTLQTGS